MDDILLQELRATNDPAEKAAIVAEFVFNMLSNKASLVARRCVILHWFDQFIIEELQKDIFPAENVTNNVYEQLISLSFVEALPWGWAFNHLTREGLLNRYKITQPNLLKNAAHLAAPVYEASSEDGKIAAEAFYCYIIANEDKLALKLLDKLLNRAKKHRNWEYINGLLLFQIEAQQLPFVHPLPFGEVHLKLQRYIHKLPDELANPINKKLETLSNRTRTYPIAHPRLSRRLAMATLISLVSVAVAGGSSWLIVSKQNPFAFGSNPTPTPIPVHGTRYITYKGHAKQVYAVAWAPDGQYIASGGDDHLVKVWSPIPPAGNDHLTYLQHSGSVNALAWSPDGTRVASASSDKTVRVWEATTGNNHFTYKGHTDNIRTVAWSLDGTRIASGGDDKTVQVWDANTGKPLVTYSGHTGIVWSVSWSPDSTHIASGSADKTVQVWDAATSGKTFSYMYHGHSKANAVKTVAWSPGGQYIASGGDIPESTVQIWNAFTGAPLVTYSEHTAGIYAIAWSLDGQYIASSSWGEVRVWNPAPPTGKTLNTYAGNANAVHAVVWSPKERRIASGGDDTTVQIWQAI